jgi:hypothetical protein
MVSRTMVVEARLDATGGVNEVLPAVSEGRGEVQRRRQASAAVDRTEEHTWTGPATY